MPTSFRSLLALFVLVVITFGFTRPAAAAEVPCYCKYGAAHADFQSAGGGADRFCPNETYWIGNITANDPLFAVGACNMRCIQAGTQFAGITSVDPSAWDSFSSNPSNMVTLESDQCVFTAFQQLPNPAPMLVEPGYAGCMKPLNGSAGAGALPQSCSYCFCKFKEGQGQISACAGKTTLIKPTSYPGRCEALCTALNMDPTGQADKSPDAHCNFTITDSCAQPQNPNASGCRAELQALGAAQASAAFQANRGTVLGQFLPLGNMSLPQFIGRLIKQILGIVGALALVFFIWGGLKYMTAAGDDKKVQEGRDMIVAAVSGLVAIFLSYTLLSLLINAIK